MDIGVGGKLNGKEHASRQSSVTALAGPSHTKPLQEPGGQISGAWTLSSVVSKS
ncbi:MAG: hypothetical protein ACYC6Y_24850 [Thermoguttaceae bacterium]